MVEQTTEEKKMAEEKKIADEKKNAEHTKAAKKKRKRVLIRLALFFTLLILIYLIYWLIWARFEEYTDDAYMSGNLVRLQPQIAGTISAIYTDDTELVQEGQPVIQMDTADMALAFQRSAGALAVTVRNVRQLYDNLQQAEAQVLLREADLDKAALDLKRREGLVNEKAISREEMMHYITALSAAQQQYNTAKANYNSALSLVQGTNLYNHPQIFQAEAAFKRAYLNYQRTFILSPVTGYVAKRSAQVGQQVLPGDTLMAIVPLNQVWVEANYKETQLKNLRIGQPVKILVDAYDGFTYHGHIHGLGAGTGSTFDLLPPQNATGNWIKIVQRLPVKIDLDPKEVRDHPLRLGLSVRVTTDTHNLSGEVLTKKPDEQLQYATDVFANQIGDANLLMNQIVTANSEDVPVPKQKLLPA